MFDVSTEDLPFVVEDENGIAHIKSYEQNEANTVIIILDRALKGKCLVHGASEQNPKSIIPIDFATHIPMLSFYGVEILEKGYET